MLSSNGIGVPKGPTAGQIMDLHKGAGPGFDLVRIGLSLAVILVHSFRVAYPDTVYLYAGPIGPLITVVLPLFFALSGFLVAGSAIRNRALRVFISFRVLRIVPALAVEITLSALILGPLLTTWSLGSYFSDTRFLTYFGNIFGWIHFHLPGVFETNPQKYVNLSLWTLHPELECYALMAVLMLTTLVYHPKVLTVIWAVATIVMFTLNFMDGSLEPNADYGTVSGKLLIYYFVTGILAYHWRHKIPINPWIMAAATLATYLLVRTPYMVMLLPPAIVYMMVWLGMQSYRRIEWLQRGDYSYGLYLYGYPIQQTLVYLLPNFREWYIIFPLASVLTLGFAMLSWHLVEKPALKLKRFVVPRPKSPPSAQAVAAS